MKYNEGYEAIVKRMKPLNLLMTSTPEEDAILDAGEFMTKEQEEIARRQAQMAQSKTQAHEAEPKKEITMSKKKAVAEKEEKKLSKKEKRAIRRAEESKAEKKSSKKDKGEKKSKKASKKEESTRESKTGKYTSFRHMVEAVFYKNREASVDDVIAIAKKEYPGCSFLTGGRTSKRFGWYKSHIVNHGEFTTVEAPKWAKGGAKIKKSKKASKKDE